MTEQQLERQEKEAKILIEKLANERDAKGGQEQGFS